MFSPVKLRQATRDDWTEIGELIHLSTNYWYQMRGRLPIFPGDPAATRLFCEVYEDLEPGCCTVAMRGDSDKIIGSCFHHPRDTHLSLGIMNVHPSYFGKGVARELLRSIIARAHRQNKPLRLVSSALNLDSFALYNRAGFIPYAVSQDMYLQVPAHGLGRPIAEADRMRDADAADVDAMVELEMAVHGIDRCRDFQYVIENRRVIWHLSVIENQAGRLSGFLVSVSAPAITMLGPGIMQNETDAASLIGRELDHLRDRLVVWLVPCNRRKLVDDMYALGARNCELHLAQVLGEIPQVKGIVIPTFMPETG